MSIKLKQLKIKNFKGFAKEQIFDFAKLTILTGGNSSGKSSVLHAILGAIQSGEFPLNFSPNGKYINMGDFREISNKHSNKDISLGYTFKYKDLKSDYTFNTIWKNNKQSSLPELKSLTVFSVDMSLELKKTRTSEYILNFTYDPKKDLDYDSAKSEEFKKEVLKNSVYRQKLTSQKNKAQLQRAVNKERKYLNTMYTYTSIRNLRIKNLDTLEKEAMRKGNMNLNYAIDGILGMFWRRYSMVINAISSFRHQPERTYLEQSKDKLKIDKSGDGYLDQILLWEKRGHPKFKELQSIMRDNFSLFSSLKANKDIGGGRYEVTVKILENGTETSLFDVGYGISQFLPIIVADLQLPEGSTLFVAEPEIHLHPNVQAEFGDYLVKQINSNKKNYVIETHSEYFLNRIRAAIVEGTLKEQDLSVYYLENNVINTKVNKIKFGRKGQIEGAPPSFFDTYLMEVKNIALKIK